MSQEEQILSLFKACKAIWIHSGDPQEPHAELTSGKCSNGYFNCSKVLQYPDLCQTLANELVKRLKTHGVEYVDWVIGLPKGGITLSYEVARIYGAIHGSLEKDPKNPKRMVWRTFDIPKGSTVLQIDDVVVTAGSLFKGRRAVEEGNKEQVNFFTHAGAVIHRPPKLPASYGEIRIVALIEKEIEVFDPENCLLCKAGSSRLRPRTHWKELTRER